MSPGPRLSSSDRRLQLLQCAIDLFARKGFSGATTREIAASAGVSEAVIFQHFPSKTALYQAVLEHRAAASGQEEHSCEVRRLMEAGDDRGVLALLFQGCLKCMREDAEFERVLLYAGLEGHEIASVQIERFFPEIARLIAYFEEREKHGVYRPGSATILVFLMIAASRFYGIYRYLLPQTTVVHDLFTEEQLREQTLDAVLRGFSALPESRRNKQANGDRKKARGANGAEHGKAAVRIPRAKTTTGRKAPARRQKGKKEAS